MEQLDVSYGGDPLPHYRVSTRVCQNVGRLLLSGGERKEDKKEREGKRKEGKNERKMKGKKERREWRRMTKPFPFNKHQVK